MQGPHPRGVPRIPLPPRHGPGPHPRHPRRDLLGLRHGQGMQHQSPRREISSHGYGHTSCAPASQPFTAIAGGGAGPTIDATWRGASLVAYRGPLALPSGSCTAPLPARVRPPARRASAIPPAHRRAAAGRPSPPGGRPERPTGRRSRATTRAARTPAPRPATSR
ncbi:predicted protein [Streptomyces sp. SPB78]|nr:predicted protein [Streptomyces sp. SPB78]